jgi:hypothetical protein
MGSKSSPAPDYRGATQETAQGNIQAAQAAVEANRVNQVTPQGSLTYSAPTTPGGQWTATQSLSPEQQALYQQGTSLSGGLLGLAGHTLDNSAGSLSQPVTAGQLPASMVNAGETGQQAYMRMAAPDLAKAREQQESVAAQSGITRGSAAWDDLQRTLGVNENNAENQSIQTGFGMGQQAQKQGFDISTGLQDHTTNIINALRTGSQVSNPSYASVPQQQATTGADALGATTAAGNWMMGQDAQRNATTNAGITAAGMAAAAYFY